ncbi:MAG: hypothetical protein AAF371_10575 [Pseudomonadota bacterium]
MKRLLFATVACLAAMPAVADPHDNMEWDSGVPVGPIANEWRFQQSDAIEAGHGRSGKAAVAAAAYDAPEAMTLSFIFHIDDHFAEQDVFYERAPGSGEVFRPTAATRDMDAPLYAPAVEVPHNFLDTSDVGPYPAGRPLGITVGEWFAAEGRGTYTCENGVGTVDLRFENLVPHGVYTVWHDFMVWPPTDPFIGTYDLPFGARDGSENVFVADDDGSARFERSVKPCLQLSGEHLAANLAIAWHSDGATYGPLPGEFSTVTHVQLYVALPARAGL